MRSLCMYAGVVNEDIVPEQLDYLRRSGASEVRATGSTLGS